MLLVWNSFDWDRIMFYNFQGQRKEPDRKHYSIKVQTAQNLWLLLSLVVHHKDCFLLFKFHPNCPSIVFTTIYELKLCQLIYSNQVRCLKGHFRRERRQDLRGEPERHRCSDLDRSRGQRPHGWWSASSVLEKWNQGVKVRQIQGGPVELIFLWTHLRLQEDKFHWSTGHTVVYFD